MKWKQAKSIENGFNIPQRWIYLMYYEAFNLLFRIENALRIFVYIVLKNKLRDKWSDAVIAGDEQETLTSLAKKRMGQAQSFGYLGHTIACPIMHLNSGELTRLIASEAYWKYFKPHFLGGKEIIKTKLEEIGSIRNSLAHFRPIRADDVDVIKQNSKHVLLGIEKFLNQVLFQNDIVPTNTSEEWYTNLKTLGTDLCKFYFQQSIDCKWVKISMRYDCPMIKKERHVGDYYWFAVLTLDSSAILKKYSEIANDVCSLSEMVSYPQMLEDYKVECGKTVSFVLSREMLLSQYINFKKSLEKLLLAIDQETELIKMDNLARGELIHSVNVSAWLKKEKDGSRWQWQYNNLLTPVMENDRPEYWGKFNLSMGEDFIAGTNEYPWMPETVSQDELPF